jgi:2-aminoadipate transaminase
MASGMFEPGYSAKAREGAPWDLAATARYDFAIGHPDPDNFPVEELAEATRRMLLREQGRMALYPSEPLHRATRELIARKIAIEDHEEIPIDHISVTSGSLQGLTMLAESFIDPGDTVVVEEFTYQGTLRAFNSCRPRYTTVPTDDQGIVVEELERVLDRLAAEGRTPKFVYVITDFQNPTGSVLSGERRRKLIDVTTERGLLVIEDDVYSDLIFEGKPEPTLYGMRRIDNVIRLGTFSKIVGAGVRVGWIVAPPRFLSHLATTKIDGGTSSFSSLAVAEYLSDRLETRVAQMQQVYRAKRDAMLGALDEHFTGFAEWSRPRGGLFIWVRLPDGMDTVARLPDARAAGVDYLPGPNFSPTRQGANYLRLSFAYLSAEDIRAGLGVLADVLAPSC